MKANYSKHLETFVNMKCKILFFNNNIHVLEILIDIFGNKVIFILSIRTLFGICIEQKFLYVVGKYRF